MTSVKLETRSPSYIVEELSRFEAVYGTPTSRLASAFTVNGSLRETPDFHRWVTLATMARHLRLDVS
jgi:hypothetical protein